MTETVRNTSREDGGKGGTGRRRAEPRQRPQSRNPSAPMKPPEPEDDSAVGTPERDEGGRRPPETEQATRGPDPANVSRPSAKTSRRRTSSASATAPRKARGSGAGDGTGPSARAPGSATAGRDDGTVPGAGSGARETAKSSTDVAHRAEDAPADARTTRSKKPGSDEGLSSVSGSPLGAERSGRAGDQRDEQADEPPQAVVATGPQAAKRDASPGAARPSEKPPVGHSSAPEREPETPPRTETPPSDGKPTEEKGADGRSSEGRPVVGGPAGRLTKVGPRTWVLTEGRLTEGRLTDGEPFQGKPTGGQITARLVAGDPTGRRMKGRLAKAESSGEQPTGGAQAVAQVVEREREGQRAQGALTEPSPTEPSPSESSSEPSPSEPSSEPSPSEWRPSEGRRFEGRRFEGRRSGGRRSEGLSGRRPAAGPSEPRETTPRDEAAPVGAARLRGAARSALRAVRSFRLLPTAAARALRRPRLLAALCVLLGVLAGAAYGLLRPTQYTATSYVAVVPGEEGDPMTALGFAQAYGRIATDTAVLAGAQQEAGVAATTLERGVEAVTSPDAPMIEITGNAPRAEEAAAMANAVARSLAEVAGDSAQDTGVELTAFSRARAPREPSTPSPVLTTAVGGSAGVLVGALVLLVRPRREERPDQTDGAAGEQQPGIRQPTPVQEKETG